MRAGLKEWAVKIGRENAGEIMEEGADDIQNWVAVYLLSRASNPSLKEILPLGDDWARFCQEILHAAEEEMQPAKGGK